MTFDMEKALQVAQMLVNEINALDNSTFETRFITPSCVGLEAVAAEYRIAHSRSKDLHPDVFQACFELIKETSASAYRDSSRGWRPKEKKAEMMDPDMRYLIVLDEASDGILGFASYMFTIEDDYPVVYLYEVHLKEQLRGKGVGSHLMRIVERFGRIAKMEKTMLTVFTSNEGAERFYKRHGYIMDEYSPQPRLLRGGKVKRPDYLILSKALQ